MLKGGKYLKGKWQTLDHSDGTAFNVSGYVTCVDKIGQNNATACVCLEVESRNLQTTTCYAHRNGRIMCAMWFNGRMDLMAEISKAKNPKRNFYLLVFRAQFETTVSVAVMVKVVLLVVVKTLLLAKA